MVGHAIDMLQNIYKCNFFLFLYDIKTNYGIRFIDVLYFGPSLSQYARSHVIYYCTYYVI